MARLAYIMSRFPVVTETFILYELRQIEAAGLKVDVYPLRRVKYKAIHAEAEQLLDQIKVLPHISFDVLRDSFAMLAKAPLLFFSTWFHAIISNAGRMKFLAAALLYFPKFAAMALRMQRDGIRHVHAHFAGHPALAAWVINRLTGIGYSFTAHGSDIHVQQEMLEEKLDAAAFAITVSDYNRTFMAEKTRADLADKIRVIRCGVDLKVFAGGEALCSTDHTFTLLCVGALREVKGHRYLIEALRLLKAEGTTVQCLLIGEGPQEKALKRQVQSAGLLNQVSFLGAQSREQVVKHLKEADAFILSSIETASGSREGIPVALMEAMACGIAVISSRLSGIPELVIHEQTGLLADPGDASMIADCIQRLIVDVELRQRLAASGKSFVASHYDLEKNAAELAELLNQHSYPEAG